LAKNQDTLKFISAGNKKPYYWHKYESPSNEMMSVLLPHLKEYRSLAKILCWEACFSAEQGKYSGRDQAPVKLAAKS
jgi:hypothetical protein